MVAIRKHGARALKHAIHGSGESRPDRLHSAPERTLVACFDDQVSMIALERVMDEPEALPITRRGECALDLTDDAHRAKRGNAVAYPERHMTGESFDDRPSRPVPDTRIRPRSASGSGPSSAVAQAIEVELFRSYHECVD